MGIFIKNENQKTAMLEGQNHQAIIIRKRGRFYLILFNKQNFHTCTVYMQ